MSLYYEAEKFLISDPASSNNNEYELAGSLTSRIFGARGLKNKAAQVFALTADTIKWSDVLSDIIERSGILQVERQLTPAQALLLTHDVLLSKNGIAANKDHPLKTAISRHRARLLAEFARARIKAGYATKEEWSVAIDRSFKEQTKPTGAPPPPRWLRINSIRTNYDTETSTTFSTFEKGHELREVMALSSSSITPKLSVDEHIPDLLAAPPSVDLTTTDSYRRGNIILQDKASCFPAYLLNPQTLTGDIIDACAAPGNKTTHLAALLRESGSASTRASRCSQQIFACEKDGARSQTLEQMVTRAGAEKLVKICAKQDFLRIDPQDNRWHNVEALLLDPSCSGSGMLDREDDGWLAKLVLPRSGADISGSETITNGKRGKKRKREGRVRQEEPTSVRLDAVGEVQTDAQAVGNADDSKSQTEALSKRLKGLSNFQVSIIKHAFSFPNAKRVVYSTCSVHVEENENVVVDALTSEVAISRGWRVLNRKDQVDGLRRWTRRGDGDAVERAMETTGSLKTKGLNAEEITEACIRCSKGTEEGTMGFFVVGFVRDILDDDVTQAANGHGEDDEEWHGFSESEHE